MTDKAGDAQPRRAERKRSPSQAGEEGSSPGLKVLRPFAVRPSKGSPQKFPLRLDVSAVDRRATPEMHIQDTPTRNSDRSSSGTPDDKSFGSTTLAAFSRVGSPPTVEMVSSKRKARRSLRQRQRKKRKVEAGVAEEDNENDVHDGEPEEEEEEDEEDDDDDNDDENSAACGEDITSTSAALSIVAMAAGHAAQADEKPFAAGEDKVSRFCSRVREAEEARKGAAELASEDHRSVICYYHSYQGSGSLIPKVSERRLWAFLSNALALEVFVRAEHALRAGIPLEKVFPGVCANTAMFIFFILVRTGDRLDITIRHVTSYNDDFECYLGELILICRPEEERLKVSLCALVPEPQRCSSCVDAFGSVRVRAVVVTARVEWTIGTRHAAGQRGTSAWMDAAWCAAYRVR